MVGPGVYKKQRGARSPHKPKKYAKEIRAAGGNGTQFHVGCALKLWPDTDLDHWRDRVNRTRSVSCEGTGRRGVGILGGAAGRGISWLRC